MEYTITFDEESGCFEMGGVLQKFVGDHLYDIAITNGITTTANSESHHMAILAAHGIKIELLESDGSKMDY